MKNKFGKILALAVLAAAAAGLQGCLYTSHHFNSGRILEPGNTAVTFGYGRFNMNEAVCDEYNGYFADRDSLGTVHCLQYRSPDQTGVPSYDTAAPTLVESSLPRFSLGYRLGVRGPWGPFTGVELGWHLEAPTNPGSAEFDLKLGLPNLASKRWFHSASGGWIIGMWADNSFFGEYAASRAFGDGDNAHALYASYRFTRLATQPDDAVGTDATSNGFNHRRRSAHQATVGFHVRLPDWPVVPDFLSPQATFSAPWVPVFNDVKPDRNFLVNLNLGIGWRF